MAIRPILTAPNEILKTPSEKVKLENGEISAELRALVQDLKDTLANASDPAGAGISAPQIGVLKRVCIVNEYMWDEDKKEEFVINTYTLINPKVISKNNKTEKDWEGCLSIPDKYGEVERPTKIKLKAIDENGNNIRMKASGFVARVILHEIDHLDGILFTDRTSKVFTEEELENHLEL